MTYKVESDEQTGLKEGDYRIARQNPCSFAHIVNENDDILRTYTLPSVSALVKNETTDQAGDVLLVEDPNAVGKAGDITGDARVTELFGVTLKLRRWFPRSMVRFRFGKDQTW